MTDNEPQWRRDSGTSLPTSMSIDQLLGVWQDLVEAYHVVNGYGGNVAEIYAYRFLRFDPRSFHEGLAKVVQREQAVEARDSLWLVLRRFEAEYDCVCKVDGHASAWDWFQRVPLFDHRVHVEVVKKERTNGQSS